MINKAASLEADAIIFDLEDSVPLKLKQEARALVVSTLATWPKESGTPYVRINSPGSSLSIADLAALEPFQAAGIVVPKVDRVADLQPVFDLVKTSGQHVIVSIETPLSLLHIESFAQHELIQGLFLGGEDLATALGMRKSSSNTELDQARFQILIAARAYGKQVFDTICPEFRDVDVLWQDARRAEAMGFDGKFAIHPAQLPVIHEAFQISESEAQLLREIVNTYDQAVREGHGAVEVNGQMIDPPVAERARTRLARNASK